MDENMTLSANEQTALEYLARKRAVPVTQIGERNERSVFGDTIPGRGVFNKLIRKGLAYETEESVMEDGFQFTPMLELTEAGEQLAEQLANHRAEPVKTAPGKRR